MPEHPPRIIAFAGSMRADSYNAKLAAAVAEGSRAAGADVRVLTMRDYPLPVYDADSFDSESADPHALFDRGGTEGGPHSIPMPEGLLRLKEQFCWADGFILSTPEYLRSYPGMVKNMFDWLSRLAPGEAPMDNFTWKCALPVCAAYEGGGITALADLRRLLIGLECIVVPGGDPFMISDTLFDENGALASAADRKRAERAGARLVRMIRAMRPSD